MSIELYPHNQKTYNKMLDSMKIHNVFYITRPTGSGKSFIFLKFIEEHPHVKSLIVSPSVYIFNQFKTYQEEANIELENVEYITFSKLSLMDEDDIANIHAQFIVIDEFHRCGATEWGRGIKTLMNTHKDSKILGTSATPIRYLDSGRHMGEELFDGNCVDKMTISEAIAGKILPAPLYVASYYSLLGELDEMENRLDRQGNENLKYRLANKIRKAKSMLSEKDFELKNIFKKHIKETNGKYIVFCSGEEKLNELMKESDNWFSEINTEVHKYKVLSNIYNSREQLKLFGKDDSDAIKLLFAVDMVNEGLHIPNTSGAVFFRSTLSMNVYYQQLGRVLSCTKTNKKPVIFDLVNNFNNANSGNANEDLLYQIRNEAYEQNSDIDFEIHDYILDIQKELNEINQIFEENWEQNFSCLKDFIKENNRFPTQFDTQYDFNIGKWCSMQRVQKKNGVLLPYREKKLDEIEFVWTPQNDAWYNRYKLIESFKNDNDRLPNSADNKSFVVWLNTQRRDFAKGYLKNEQIKMLEELGVNLKMSKIEQAWQDNYECLTNFLESNENLPQFEDVHEDKKIGSWLCEQRKKYRNGKLSEEQQSLLEDLGVVFGDKFELIFKQNYELLVEYLSLNKQMPNTKTVYNNFNLGLWCERIKADYSKNKLSAEQIEMLNKINFDFRTAGEIRKDLSFEKNYTGYLNFVNKYEKRPTSKTESSLYVWYSRECKKLKDGVLSIKNQDKLSKIIEL
ncbi:MAG: Helicase associated domain protein, partial [Clostridia bacterium]